MAVMVVVVLSLLPKRKPVGDRLRKCSERKKLQNRRFEVPLGRPTTSNFDNQYYSKPGILRNAGLVHYHDRDSGEGHDHYRDQTICPSLEFDSHSTRVSSADGRGLIAEYISAAFLCDSPEQYDGL